MDSEADMSLLKVTLFGSIRVAHNTWEDPVKLTPSIQALFAFLLLNRYRLYPREVLIEVFWAERDPGRARNCLNTALWRLRQAIEPGPIGEGTFLLTNDQGDIGFNNHSDYWLDIEIFEENLSSILNQPIERVNPVQVEHMERALELYEGDLLEGFYDDWALHHREYMRQLYLRSLAFLMDYHEHQRAYPKSIACGQRIVELDPLREEIHRNLMRLYVLNGQRPFALRQYETCRLTLLKEVGIAPMEETVSLYQSLLQGAAPPFTTPLVHSSEDIRQAIARLERTQITLLNAQQDFQKALDSLLDRLR